MDFGLALMCGTDIPIPECKLIMHQPTIQEISYIGEAVFFTAIQTLNVNTTMLNLKDEIVSPDINNFHIFMMIMAGEDKTKKEAVKQLFELILPQYKVSFLPRSLMFVTEEDRVIVDENNFQYFQNVIQQIFCLSSNFMTEGTFNPRDELAAEIARKIAEGRARVAAQKGENAEGKSAFSQHLSVLTVGLHIPLQHLMKLTMYQLLDLEERYSLYINWDLDIKARLAGAKSDTQVDNWMKNIH